MSKPKPKEKPAEPEPEEKPEETEEAAPEGEEPEVETPEPDAEKEALKKENDELKRKLATPAPLTPAPAGAPKVTAAQMRMMSPQEREAVETHFGMKFDDIVARVESQEARAENTEIKARLNVKDAIEEAMSADPQVHKLKAGMTEYLQSVSLEDRADPEKLKHHIARAKTYARGALAERGTTVRPPAAKPKGGKTVEPSPEGEEIEPDEDAPEGAIKPGAELQVGEFKIKVADLIPAEMRKRIKHPTDANGVMFRGYDKAPKFAGRGG